MGSVYKKKYTKPVPDGAEAFTRKGQKHVRWTDHRGKRKTAKLTIGKDGSDRLLVEAGTYTAKYRDGSGIARVSRDQFVDLAGSGAVTGQTVVFDNTLTTVGAVREGRWELPAGDSWHGQAFFT